MNIYTVAFFGHRQVGNFRLVEQRLEQIIRTLLNEKEYVDFLVGRNGDFDQLVSSTIVRLKRVLHDGNSSHILVLPYMTAEYTNNQQSFDEYYDEVILSDAAVGAHYKSAIQARNREMVDRADLVICCIEHKYGGAYQTIMYARKNGKEVINLADDAEWEAQYPD